MKHSAVSMRLDQAFKNFTASKLRSFLAVLGILVGTASVVALVTCGRMATDKALSQLKALGTDLISVRMYNMQSNKSSAARKLSLDSVLTLPKKIKGVHSVSPFINVYSNTILFKGQRLDGNIIGVTHQTKPIFKMTVQQGRFISFLDTFEHYCVIGHDVYQQIKQQYQGEVLGQQIWLGKQDLGQSDKADQQIKHDISHSDISDDELLSRINKLAQSGKED